MPLLNVPANTWTTVVTTTTDTTFQNRGSRPVYIVTESTSGLPNGAGWELEPRDFITIGTGMDVKVNAHSPGVIYYGEIT